ncbi:SUMF1/EgtB/PvdO family nonheme iron enzyme [Pseudenhygromyxa sp. WMMC2535]|uniref:formylglycine-generating enzyme family protein n=1 Tax=Pseudenhygromyxa sp. WMMC2535 TaxID=2712867 RepID=UPI0015573204|nr:SUMF1/EgtB/PvdO family nonheme iron enzyme [Pseudenhygromyxa sp. WMMC2535]NVB40636.1 SUMF1/EgtB/PvdO family nonheme iron enzyme [Pseudenhygromyxa sp. WMMC2535]
MNNPAFNPSDSDSGFDLDTGVDTELGPEEDEHEWGEETAEEGEGDEGEAGNGDEGESEDESDPDAGDGDTVGCDTALLSPPDPAMACIPAGPRVMGCAQDNPANCAPDELPAHPVELSSFFVDRYEVSVDDYAACVAEGTCTSSADKQGCNTLDTPALPINCVSWYQAQAYCQWRGKRLPTEAEWERAAAGSGSTTYPWGWDAPTCERAVIYGCDGLQAVDSLAEGASEDGLHHTIGNVSEWVSDWHSPSYYEDSPVHDPGGPEAGNSKIVRGGSFETASLWELEVYDRGLPVSPDLQSPMYGFRCAASLAL